MRVLRARLLAAAQERGRRRRLASRRSQVRTVDRSERVRTYNFPENRISDHRVGFKAYNLDQVLDGALDDVIAALQHGRHRSAARRRGDVTLGALPRRGRPPDGWPTRGAVAAGRRRCCSRASLGRRAARAPARPRAPDSAARPSPVAAPAGGPRTVAAHHRHAAVPPIELAVGPGVFVPRPETELLVDAALPTLRGRGAPLVVDLCSGSGALARRGRRRGPRQRGSSRSSGHPARCPGCAATPRAPGGASSPATSPTRSCCASCADGRRRARQPAVRAAAAIVDVEVRADPAAAVFGGVDGLTCCREASRGPPSGCAPAGVRDGARRRQGAVVPELLARDGRWTRLADHGIWPAGPATHRAPADARTAGCGRTAAGGQDATRRSAGVVSTTAATRGPGRRGPRPRTASRPASWSSCPRTPSTASARTHSTRPRWPTCCARRVAGGHSRCRCWSAPGRRSTAWSATWTGAPGT